MGINNELARKFVDRATHLGLKGKKRDDAVLEFFCGAATALELAGRTDEANQVTCCATMLLATRGYLGLLPLVTVQDEKAA